MILHALLSKLVRLMVPRETSRRRRVRHTTFESLEPRILLATRIWDGGAISNDKWSDNKNWVGNVAPVSNDDLVFPAGIGLLDRGTNNDIFSTTFKSLRFEGSDYKLTGQAVKLSGDVTVLPSLAPSTIELDITFLAANHGISVGTASTLSLNGRLKNFPGDGLITKSGEGDLIFGGEFTNTLSLPLHVDQGNLGASGIRCAVH